MKCPSCGAEANPNDKFCIKCGKPLEAHHYCNKCGARLFEGQKFCNKCGAEVQVRKENSHKNRAVSLANRRTLLLIIGIVLLIIVAAFFSGAFESESRISGKGFSASFPKGYTMVEDKYLLTGANTVPLYMIYDEKGTNVLNISGIPKKITNFNNTSDIESSMSADEFKDIEKVKLGDAEGYRGEDTFLIWKGMNTAYVMLDGSRYCYKIDYLNEGNLSFLKNASFTDYVPISHITEPDEGRIYHGINSVELEGETFTLTAPEGWNITEYTTENETRYDVINERGSIKNTIIDFDGREYVYNESDVKDVFYYFFTEYWNASDVRSYYIGGVEGISIANPGHDYAIVAINGWHSYVILYSDEESLGVINTMKFK